MHRPAVSGLRPRPRPVRPAVIPAAPAATGMTDRAGRVLALGSAVLLLGGEHAGRVGEVVGDGGRRGVELVLHGPRPAFLALQPVSVELVEVALLDPIVPRWCSSEASAPAGSPSRPVDRPPGEPQPDGAVPGGPRTGAAAGEQHQLP
jgi:hypothetical protein